MTTFAQQEARQRAERALLHYLRTVWQRAGLHWDHDNAAEVRGIVEDLVAACIPEVPRAPTDVAGARHNIDPLTGKEG